MYFYKQKGKQVLDLTGDLVLTHNSDPLKTRAKSCAPAAIRGGQYIKLNGVGFWRRVYIMIYVAAWVWRSSLELTPEKTAFKKPYKKQKPCMYYHQNKSFCLHEFNLDNSCIGYDKCRYYTTVESCQCKDDNGKPLNDCSNCPR